MTGRRGAPRGATGTTPRIVGFFRPTEGDLSEVRRAVAAGQPHLPVVCDIPGRLHVAAATDTEECVSAVGDDGSFLVLSGRWYHHESLEVVLGSWLSSGESALRDVYFQGIIAGWDAGTGRFALLRDRYGVETGYYADWKDGILFSDEQHALVQAGVDHTPDAVAIDVFLACGYFPAPLTPYQSISKLAPGNLLSYRGGLWGVAPWVQHERRAPVPYEEALRGMPDTLRTAVERIWPSRGDVGVLLSGGIDSAMVLTAITRMLGADATAFTFRYADYAGPLNEFDAARVVSSHLGVGHEQITIRSRDLIEDLDAAVAAYGEPLNWGLHSYRLGPLADGGIGAVFSGVGADGTGLTKRHNAALRFDRLPGPAKALMRAGVRAARPLRLRAQSRMEWVTRRTSGIADMFSPDSTWDREQRARLYGDPSLAHTGSQRAAEIFATAALALDRGDRPAALIMMDKLHTSAEAMMAWNRAWPRAHGMTPRLPFFDPDLIDLGLRVEGTTAGKDLIRRVAAGLLPSRVVTAPKVAQQMPVSHWLRGPMAGPAREILSSMPANMAAILDRRSVVALVDDHAAGKTDAAWRIVSLLTMESWFRQNADLG